MCIDHYCTGTAALPVLWRFFDQYSKPEDAIQANVTDIANMFAPLGLQNKRANIIMRFSGMHTYPCV